MQIIIEITTPPHIDSAEKIDFETIKELIRMVPKGREATIVIPPSQDNLSHVEIKIIQG